MQAAGPAAAAATAAADAPGSEPSQPAAEPSQQAAEPGAQPAADAAQPGAAEPAQAPPEPQAPPPPPAPIIPGVEEEQHPLKPQWRRGFKGGVTEFLMVTLTAGDVGSRRMRPPSECSGTAVALSHFSDVLFIFRPALIFEIWVQHSRWGVECSAASTCFVAAAGFEGWPFLIVE